MALFLENQGMEDNTPRRNQPDKHEQTSMCALSRILICMGAVEIFIGIICASEISVIYLVCGIVSAVFSFALAVIVDACQKYRQSH